MTNEAAENFIFKAIMYGAGKSSFSDASRVMDPLVWYLATGRASYDFRVRLATKKPYRVFQVMHKAGGSYDDAIQAVKHYLGIV